MDIDVQDTALFKEDVSKTKFIYLIISIISNSRGWCNKKYAQPDEFK